jgi:hypothetical protein
LSSCAVETVEVQASCTECRRVGWLTVGRRALDAWRFGNLKIQDAFPQLSPADREWIKSGICGPCFDRMFAPPPSRRRRRKGGE